MATGWPMKVTYANGDVYSASDVNDITGTINLLGSSVAYTAGKNKIINGDFGVWQRGTSFTTNGVYTADRYFMQFSGTLTAQTVSRQSFTAGTAPVSGYEGTYFCRNVVTGGSGASSLVLLVQKIEDVRTFAGQTITFSFWAKAASGTPSIGLDFYQEFGTTGSPSATVSNGGTKVAITTSWARYSVTVAIASIAGKTITSNSQLGARFWFSSGSDYNAFNNSLGIQSNTFDIWGVQIEAGSTATAFQTATGTIQGELAACQRYYYRQTGDNLYAQFGSGTCTTTTNALISTIAPVTMRVKPSAVEFATLRVFDGSSAYAVTAISLNTDHSGASAPVVNATIGTASFTLVRNAFIQGNNSAAAYLGFSAEL